MVLDMAKPKNKKSTIWPGMGGRDAVTKSIPKVNILQVFTIDFSQIQFIVNHNSQTDGQNKIAKSGMNLRKKIIHINSLQKKKEKIQRTKVSYSEQSMQKWTDEALIWLQSRCHDEKSLTPRIRRTNLKTPFIQVNKDEYNKDKKFSPKMTSPALELTNIQHGNIGFHLQVPHGGAHPNGVGCELTFFLLSSHFSLLLQLVSFTVDVDPL